MQQKLAIIGASYLQLPLVEKAKELGIYTICFAWEEGAVCKEICNKFYPISIIEKEKILNICKKLEINGIASIASDVAVPTVNYVAYELGLTGNSNKCSKLATHKYLMRKAFKKHELPIPWFIEIEESYKIQDLLNLRYPIIIKPVDRSGSRGITVLNSSERIEQAIKYALKESFDKKVIIEEFIEGKEISVEAISWRGEHHILTFTDKVTNGYPHFVELEHHQPSIFIDSNIEEKIIKIVQQGLDSLLIKNGASHSELIITYDNDVYITEIGARMGGDFIGSHLVYLSTDFDYLKAVIEISLGSFEKPDIEGKKFSGVFFYSNESKNILAYKNDNRIIKSEFKNLTINKLKQSSDRSGYLIYQSNNKFNIA